MEDYTKVWALQWRTTPSVSFAVEDYTKCEFCCGGLHQVWALQWRTTPSECTKCELPIKQQMFWSRINYGLPWILWERHKPNSWTKRGPFIVLLNLIRLPTKLSQLAHVIVIHWRSLFQISVLLDQEMDQLLQCIGTFGSSGLKFLGMALLYSSLSKLEKKH